MPFDWGSFWAVLVAVPIGGTLGKVAGKVILELLGVVDD
jgi:hypothetical protein